MSSIECLCDTPSVPFQRDERVCAIKGKIVKLIKRQIALADHPCHPICCIKGETCNESSSNCSCGLDLQNLSQFTKILFTAIGIILCVFLGMYIGARMCGRTNTSLMTY